MIIDFDYPWHIKAWKAVKPYIMKSLTFIMALLIVFVFGLFIWSILDIHVDWNDKYNTSTEYALTYVSSRDSKEKTVKFNGPNKGVRLNLGQLWHKIVIFEGNAVANTGDTLGLALKKFDDVKEIKKFVRFKQTVKNNKNHGKDTAKKK